MLISIARVTFTRVINRESKVRCTFVVSQFANFADSVCVLMVTMLGVKNRLSDKRLVVLVGLVMLCLPMSCRLMMLSRKLIRDILGNLTVNLRACFELSNRCVMS